MHTLTAERQLDYEKLSLVASKTENAVVITDKYRIIEWVNEAFTTITEFTFDEAIGKSPGQLLQGKNTDPRHVEAIRSQFQTGQSFVQEILNYTKSGKAYWLRLSITPIRNEFDEITNYIAIESDITQEKKQEQELKKALRRSQEAEERLKSALSRQEELSNELMLADLKFKSTFKQEKNIAASLQKYRSDLQNTQEQLIHKEKMAGIGLLTANLAHEINNPVNFISNGVSSLKNLVVDLKEYMSAIDQHIFENLPDEAKQKVGQLKDEYELEELITDMGQMVADVEEGAQRTVEIIDSLRLSARGDEDEKSSASLEQLIDASLTLLKNKVGKIRIEKKYGKISEIDCFPGPVSQVFTNVLTNAIQAIPSGQKGLIKITTTETRECQKVTITDDGVGIPEKIQNRIFDSAFTTKKVGEGTGLGMSISQQIIEQRHQGKITFESKEGKGTQFMITLPKQFTTNTPPK